MRIQYIVRLLVGLVFLVVLPTGEATSCLTSADCKNGKCCKADLTCSKKKLASVSAGKKVTDACECKNNIITSAGTCGCADDIECQGNRCCTAAGLCSKRDLGSTLPGRIADDACECTAAGITTSDGTPGFIARCMCDDSNPDCHNNKCCKVDNICSTRDKQSVLVGVGAGDSCECASGILNPITRKCNCSVSTDCPNNKCCTSNGTCSSKTVGSLFGGKIPSDTCECASGAVFPASGRCTCTDDSHCQGDKCCGVNSICSARSKASVLSGKTANDVCECATGAYDPVTRRCGCSIDRHCTGNTCCKADNHCSSADAASVLTGAGPVEDACICVSGKYNTTTQKCFCTKDSHCAGTSCCKADNTCSERAVSSVLPGGIASDACECSTKSYSADTGQCKCGNDKQCTGAKCCGASNTCSVVDASSVANGLTASDACECISKKGYSVDPTTGTGLCGCTSDNHCEGNKCCNPDGACSKKAGASVPLSGKATYACECASGALSATTGKCVCSDDSHCLGDTCCGDGGKCSIRPKSSVAAGLVATYACECATGVHFPGSSPNKGRCGCADDTHCTKNKCCRADGICSGKKKNSVLPGSSADDICECSTVSYDPILDLCGCTETAHCKDFKEDGVDGVCAADTGICEAGAVGDPHMTGFSGQKFDFTGKDGAWYALISEPSLLHLNMRVTTPVPSVPEITYITGFSLMTTDNVGLDHSIVITAKTPHNLDTTCPGGVSPCLADGSLTVILDGEEVVAAPGAASLGPGIEITAVNTPGECRSFGFETYWERKKQENAAFWANKKQQNTQDNRELGVTLSFGDWLLSNPTATNKADCTEYVARSTAVAGGLFAHQSEHSSFRINTPAMNIRLSHGKLHQLAMRDPTDTIDLPDHVTWQMNIAIDHTSVSGDATGILGETIVPTIDTDGNKIMHGIESIRGIQEDYAVEGPLGTTFTMDRNGAAFEDATGVTFP